MTKKQNIRGFGKLVITATFAVLGAMHADMASADLSQKAKFNIAPQQLKDALLRYSEQSGIQITSQADLIEGKSSSGVNGSLTARAALDSLLRGTQLTYDVIGSSTVTIRSTSSLPAKQSQPLKQSSLPEFSVGADAINVAQLGLAEEAASDEQASKKTKTDKKASTGSSVEEMIVEDSKIKPFSDANADLPRTISDAQPYYIFDSETIRRSAATNIEDFLKQRLTMNTAASMSSQRTGTLLGSTEGAPAAPFGNTSEINLRGLGSDKTLVLINGRRRANVVVSATGAGYTTTSQPDLNGIPLDAIDRIEVLPTSASAIYGGGAVGGVINVILKRDYSGGQVRVSYDNLTDTDAPNRSVSASYGLNVGKTQMTFSASWSDTAPLLFQDRRKLFDRGLQTLLRNDPSAIFNDGDPFLGSLPNISSTGEYLVNPDGSIVTPFVNRPDPGTLTLKDGTQLGSRFTYVSAGISPNTSQAQLYQELKKNAGSWNLDLPPIAQYPTGLTRQLNLETNVSSFMMSVRRPITSWLEVSLDISRSEDKSALFTSPFGYSYTIPSNAPLNPFTSAIVVKVPDAFGRDTPADTQSNNVVLGFTTKSAVGWSTQFDLMWSRNNTQNLTFLPLISRSALFGSNLLVTDILSGKFNPLVDTLSYPLNLQKYAYAYARDFHSYQKGAALRGSGPLVTLPWGTPQLTIGVERGISGTPANNLANDRDQEDLVYYSRQRTSDSLYAEMSIPLVKQGVIPLLRTVELQIAGRSERSVEGSGSRYVSYSRLTGQATYEGAINGRPYFSQTTYSSHNETFGVKYQPISQLILRGSLATAFIPPTSVQLAISPAAPTSTTIRDPKNNNQQFVVQRVSGGNPDLKPQSSKSLNAGIVWEPTGELLRGLRVNSEYYRIQQFDAISTLNAQLMVDNEQSYAGRVTRNSLGSIVLVDTSYVNLYRRDTAGWDLSLNYALKTGIGTFDLNAAESIILHIKNQYSLTLPENDSINIPSEGGAAKYKSNFQLTWERNNFSLGWATRYVSSYKQYGAAGGPTSLLPLTSLSLKSIQQQGSDTIPAQAYHDTFASYSFAQKSGIGANNWFGSGLTSGLVVQGGVKNVFGKEPPFDVRYDFFSSPYGDLRLRSYWLSVQKSF